MPNPDEVQPPTPAQREMMDKLAERVSRRQQAKCLRDVGFNMQCQEPEGHVGPCRWHRPTAFG